MKGRHQRDAMEFLPRPARPRDALLLDAEESGFLDGSLIAATSAIKDILANIPADVNGRTLSFLNTRMGTLLAWVEHGHDAWEGAVTAKDDDATIAAALKLKNVTFADAAQAN